MSRHIFFRLSLPAVAAAALLACTGDAPSAPSAGAEAGPADHGGHAALAAANVETALDPFTFRATLEPFKIHQLPDFLMHSKATADVVMQRLVFNPGPGIWHTHPGPSFVYVIQGEIRLDRYTKKEGCTQTPVSSAGDVYYELADLVHRAVVTSAEPAVVLVTRFNIPVGQPITVPVADPGC